jgi:hypothetical protein
VSLSSATAVSILFLVVVYVFQCSESDPEPS